MIAECVTVAVLVILSASSAEARHAFVVRASVPVVSQWIVANGDAVATAARWTVVARGGDVVRVTRSSPRGTFDLTLRETRTDTTYRTDLIQCNSGGVTGQSLVATLRPVRAGTLVSIRISAAVEGVGEIVLRAGLKQSLHGIERALERVPRRAK